VRPQSLFARVKNKFNSWKIPSWQLTGMGSLAASLLVVVMIWHENPNDPIQVASAPDAVTTETAPKPAPTLAQGELAGNQLEKAEESAQSAAAPELPASKQAPENDQDKAEAKIAGKTEATKQKAEIAPQVAAIEDSADKAIVASAPAASSTNAEKDAVSRRAKAREQSDAVAMSAPAPTAPVAVEAASASAASAPTSATVQMKKMADAEKSESRTKAAVTDAVKPDEADLAIAISKQGGEKIAQKDIQAGRLRILYLGNVAASGEVLDAATGYKKEAVLITDEANAKALAIEVEAYNQTMREWHSAHGI
jgi:hypothetical protein